MTKLWLLMYDVVDVGQAREDLYRFWEYTAVDSVRLVEFHVRQNDDGSGRIAFLAAADGDERPKDPTGEVGDIGTGAVWVHVVDGTELVKYDADWERAEPVLLTVGMWSTKLVCDSIARQWGLADPEIVNIRFVDGVGVKGEIRSGVEPLRSTQAFEWPLGGEVRGAVSAERRVLLFDASGVSRVDGVDTSYFAGKVVARTSGEDGPETSSELRMDGETDRSSNLGWWIDDVLSKWTPLWRDRSVPELSVREDVATDVEHDVSNGESCRVTMTVEVDDSRNVVKVSFEHSLEPVPEDDLPTRFRDACEAFSKALSEAIGEGIVALDEARGVTDRINEWKEDAFSNPESIVGRPVRDWTKSWFLLPRGRIEDRMVDDDVAQYRDDAPSFIENVVRNGWDGYSEESPEAFPHTLRDALRASMDARASDEDDPPHEDVLASFVPSTVADGRGSYRVRGDALLAWLGLEEDGDGLPDWAIEDTTPSSEPAGPSGTGVEPL